ncbi:hypothetical protein HB364_16375 [Pseudoflavitalea sp. X16]|uniref:hypothetical protein n=1 Tax=Paraflavitalea devenefica TaxID=2716334 RepID=UPI00141E3335|nr:hypothetical protein [Paraflavitalea devenefica]NII26666.1 hypothetical protein [Paraflavitalea devenefica]
MIKQFAGLLTVILFVLVGCKEQSGSGRRNIGKTVKDSVATPPPTASLRPPYNILIENSGSMNGYVAMESDFKTSVLSLITDLKSKDITDVVNIYYINNQLCPQQVNSQPSDIQYFFRNLNPASFKASGCGTSSSFIPEIIQKAISTHTDDVNILISDFIFSDSQGASPKYLDAAQNTLELYLSHELKQRDFSTIILKLNSQFNGVYYVESQRPLTVNLSDKGIRRPYYIMVFGKQQALGDFLSKIHFADYKGFENSYYLLTPEGARPKAKVIRNNKIGDFEIEQPSSKLVINNAQAGGRNADPDVFQFSVAADLGMVKMDKSFLDDRANYEVPENYTIVSIARNTDETNESLKGYTHVFTVKTSDLKQKQDVAIKLKSKLPAWVGASSTINDTNPLDSIQQGQTFGFSYLVSGISEAYSNRYNGQEQFSIMIKVSKNNYVTERKSYGAIWWIILGFLVLVVIIIWIKNKK